jgi:2-iminobutanoate/2-iminopropanoate deaminase
MTELPIAGARETEHFVFASGNGPIDPETGEIVSDDVTEQTIQTLENVGRELEDKGVGFEDIIKVTVFITDEDYYDAMNEGYAKIFDEPYPARSAVVTGIVTEGQKVEIEAIAEK